MNPQNPETNQQDTPLADPQASAPQQIPIQDTPVDPNNVATLALQEQHKQSRRKALRITAAIICVVSIFVMILTAMGSASQDYTYVQSLSTKASMSAYFLIAGAMGVFLAYRSAHPVKLKKLGPLQQSLQLRPVNVFLVIGGFILGIIPGIIWAALITYPLSKHACQLSGSKYC